MEKVFSEAITKLSDRVIQLESSRNSKLNSSNSNSGLHMSNSNSNILPPAPYQDIRMSESKSTARLEPGRIRPGNGSGNNDMMTAKTKGRY
jgi:hypothetical protein